MEFLSSSATSGPGENVLFTENTPVPPPPPPRPAPPTAPAQSNQAQGSAQQPAQQVQLSERDEMCNTIYMALQNQKEIGASGEEAKLVECLDTILSSIDKAEEDTTGSLISYKGPINTSDLRSLVLKNYHYFDYLTLNRKDYQMGQENADKVKDLIRQWLRD